MSRVHVTAVEVEDDRSRVVVGPGTQNIVIKTLIFV